MRAILPGMKSGPCACGNNYAGVKRSLFFLQINFLSRWNFKNSSTIKIALPAANTPTRFLSTVDAHNIARRLMP